MGTIENVQIFSKPARPGDTNYVMFLEWEGRRFSQIWGLSENNGLNWKDVARELLDRARADLELDPEYFRTIGSSDTEVLPEWIFEGWTKLDWQ